LLKFLGGDHPISISMVITVEAPEVDSGVKRSFCKDTFKGLYLAGIRPIEIMTEMEISPNTYYRLRDELLEDV